MPAGLGSTLSGSGPFTVFASTDAAFSALLAELGEAGTRPRVIALTGGTRPRVVALAA